MIGAIFPGDRTVQLLDFPDPTPGPGEVVLEMKASGMCGSDLKAYRGTANTVFKRTGPTIAGHEPCGVVVEVGSGVDPSCAKVGDRMMVHHYKGCGACAECFSGWAQLCNNLSESYGNNAHGGHATYLKVPASTLVQLPEGLSYEVGAAISCGSGTAWGALKRIELSGSDTLLVVGQGPVGLAVTQFGVAMGARVIVLDIQNSRLDQARAFGAETGVNTQSQDALEAVLALTGGKGASKVVETSGTAVGTLDAVRCAGKWGSVAFVGMGASVNLDVTRQIIVKQLTLKGSWTFSKSWQAECADFVVKRQIAVDRLFTHRWSLQQADEAYRLFDTQTTGKAVICM